MKETVFRPARAPYSLHDMRMTSVRADSAGTVVFGFADGFVKPGADRVQGIITVTKVDYDFASVMLLDRRGDFGPFRGETMVLTDLSRCLDKGEFEITDELYAPGRLRYEGYFWPKGEGVAREMILSIGYFAGDILYTTEE